MKSIILSLVLFFGPQAGAKLCDGLFVADQTDMQKSQSKREKMAQMLVNIGMGDMAYVARWAAKHAKAQGPFTKTGETLVVGVEKDNYDKWMRNIGKSSIGIGVYGLPEDKTGTAYLRIGDQFFNHVMAAAGKKPKTFKRVFKNGEAWSHSYGLTEATIMLTASEIKDILKFFRARGTGQIVAQEEMRDYFEGEILDPEFSHSGKDLFYESCAGACTSFLSDLWLDNMNDQKLANRLRKIREKYNLNFNYVARANVWQNFRNPAAHISVMRIETSKKDLVQDFISENSWGNIRGLYKYAFMPDGRPSNKKRTHEVASYRSQRISLADYLDGE